MWNSSAVQVITGGSAGLGKATAKDLASRGAIVVLACRDIEAAKEVVKEIKKEIPSAQMVTSTLFYLFSYCISTKI